MISSNPHSIKSAEPLKEFVADFDSDYRTNRQQVWYFSVWNCKNRYTNEECVGGFLVGYSKIYLLVSLGSKILHAPVLLYGNQQSLFYVVNCHFSRYPMDVQNVATTYPC